jgi:hypothetical protein
MSRQASLALMVLCLLVAAALRIPDLAVSPPGLHYDEAANGILASEIAFEGQRPVFIPSYTGKEVLFFYLAGSLIRAAGQSIFTLRLTSALVGILTIAVTYWLGWELMRDRRIAILAAALLAVSFWHVLLSRLGFRAITQPLLQALTVAALFRGFRNRSWIWTTAAGISFGATAYTYLAARVFPLLLALSLLPVLLLGHDRRQRWLQVGLFLVVAIVVLLPLSVYFIGNPGAFWTRVGQVLPEDGTVTNFFSNFARSLGMLFLIGDPYWRFNIPFKPLFGLILGGFLVAGWVLALVRVWRRPGAIERSANLLLVLLPIFMLLPTALASGEIIPSNLRAVGLLPLIIYLPTIGIIALTNSLEQPIVATLSRFTGKEEQFRLTNYLQDKQVLANTTTFAIVALVLTIGGIVTGREYFQSWTQRTDLFYESDGDLASVAEFLDAKSPGEQKVFLAAEHYRHPTVAFLSDRYDQINWLPQSQALVFPTQGSSLYIYPYNNQLPEWADKFLSTATVTTGPTGPDGQPQYLVYEVQSPVRFATSPDETGLRIPNPIMANFENQVTLLGYDIDAANEADTLPVMLYWRIEEDPVEDIAPFIHMEDSWRFRWSQVEPFAYPAEQWAEGDTIVQRVEVPLQPGMPRGDYRIRIGLFNPLEGTQLARLDDAGRYAGNASTIDGVMIPTTLPRASLPEPPIAINQKATQELTLLGYERAGEKVAAGAPLWLALWWQSFAPLEAMTARFELLRPDNTGLILVDTQPVHDTYPFTHWSIPQFVIDHQTLRVPAEYPPGDYRLNLRLLDAGDETVMTADLGPIMIEDVERLFSPPKMNYPLAATFGNQIHLSGYDLEATGPNRFNLSLVWQAESVPAESYTVFVHVLDQEGNCCVWQQDIIPLQGTYPTDRWLQGEVINDKYQIELPDELPEGSYPIEIGLYFAETGQRLLVEMAGLRADDALVLRPVILE